MPTETQQSDINAAQAAIDVNLRRLRLGPLSRHTPKTHLTMLLISLFEWCAHHDIDFDATVSELREQFAIPSRQVTRGCQGEDSRRMAGREVLSMTHLAILALCLVAVGFLLAAVLVQSTPI